MTIIPRTSIGIEIAGQDLRIAAVRAFMGKRRLLRMDVLSGFLALSEEERVNVLVAHFKRNRLSHFNVHLTLPGTWGVTRDLEFPAAAGLGDKLRSAVALQAENLSPWGLDEVYWDCIWEPAGKATRSIVVHVGIISREVLNPWIALFRSASLALTGASLSSLSWAHGATSLWGATHPVLVFCAEKDHAEGTLVRGDRINSVAVEGEDTAAVVQSAGSQLVRSGRLNSMDGVRVVVHGTASAEAGVESIRLPLDGAANAPTAFGAIATALLGLTRSGFGLNLIPAPLRFQRNYVQMIPTYALVLLLALLGVFAWIRDPYQQSVYAGQLDREAQRLAVQVRPVADQEAQLNRISDRLKTINALVQGRDANLEALRELSRILPQGTWVYSYHFQDNMVTIAGFSESAASIQKLLEDSSVFSDAQFTSAILRDSSGKDRFTVRAAIKVKP